MAVRSTWRRELLLALALAAPAEAQTAERWREERQRLVADEAVHGYLYQPQWVTVADKRVRGLWNNMPIFVNDLSAMSWA